MMKRFLTGVLSIIAGTALVLTSFAGACSEDTGSVNGPPAQETPSAAFRGPSGTPFRNGNSSGAGTGMDRSRGDRVLSM